MTITSRLQELFLWTYIQWFLVSVLFQRRVPPLPPPPPIDIEAQEAAAPPVLPGPKAVGNVNMVWGTITVGFCLSSAAGVALSSTPAPSPNTSFHIFPFIISLCFASFFVSHFIHSRFLFIARVLSALGIFFAVTAFFIAITIHFPLYLKLITWLICALSLFVIFVSKFVLNNTAST